MTQLRVMTWNVQNLFEPGTSDGGPRTADAYRNKIASLAAVIDTARLHLLALQEVGPPEALAPLQAALGWKMRHSVLGEPDGRGIRVAFLSTNVLRDVSVVRLFPAGLIAIQVGDPPGADGPPTMNQMGRPALTATIRTGGRDVTIVNCHLKSKLLSYPDGRFSPRDENERARFAAYALYRRTSEATTLRSHITDHLADRGRDYPYIVVGDLNDEAAAATTQILQGPPGSEIGTAGFTRPDNGDGQRLSNLAPLLPPDRAHSRIFQRPRGTHRPRTRQPKIARRTPADHDRVSRWDDDPIDRRQPQRTARPSRLRSRCRPRNPYDLTTSSGRRMPVGSRCVGGARADATPRLGRASHGVLVAEASGGRWD